jgi:hypothetical protein
MSSFTHDEAAIIWATRLEVHKTLETSKAWFCRVLVLVRPWLILWEVGAIVEANVDCVEGHNEIGSTMDFLECFDNTRFGPNLPYEILMRGCIVQDHSLFIDNGEIIPFDSARIVSIISEVAIASSTIEHDSLQKPTHKLSRKS